MKKENILVVVLIVIALGAVMAFKLLSPPEPEPAGAMPSKIVQDSGTSSDAVTSGTASSDASSSDTSNSDTASSDSGSFTGIDWKDYTPGMALAREKNKSVFLYFHAPWCTYCTKLKMTTFQDDKVLAYLKENFVSIQVDTDQNRSLAGEWNVTGLPTLWFLEPSGKKINNMPGYVTADQLLQILRYIHTKSYTTMAFHEFVKQN